MDEIVTLIDTKLQESCKKLFQENAKEMKVKWSKIVSKEVESKLVEVSKNLTKVKETIKETNKKVYESKDRENRVNNIVIY